MSPSHCFFCNTINKTDWPKLLQVPAIYRPGNGKALETRAKEREQICSRWFMAATATFISISHPLLFSPSFIPKPKHQISSNSCKPNPSFPSPLKLVQPHLPSSSRYFCPAPLRSKRWELSAHQGTLFLLDISPVEESAQEIVSTTTDGGGSSYSIVAVLIFVAFICLSVLTIGVRVFKSAFEISFGFFYF